MHVKPAPKCESEPYRFENGELYVPPDKTPPPKPPEPLIPDQDFDEPA